MKITASASHHLTRALPQVYVIQLWTSLTLPCVGTGLITRTAPIRHGLVDERASGAHPLRQIVWLHKAVIVLVVRLRLQLHLIAEQSYHGSIYLVKSVTHSTGLYYKFFFLTVKLYEGGAEYIWPSLQQLGTLVGALSPTM